LFPEIGVHDPTMDIYQWIEHKRIREKLNQEKLRENSTKIR